MMKCRRNEPEINENGGGDRMRESLSKSFNFWTIYFIYSKLNLQKWKNPGIYIECKHKQMTIAVHQIDNLTTERKNIIEIIQVVLKPELLLHS